MGKINFKESTVPATLNEGELVVVDGITYVGNADNEIVPSKGYKELSFVYRVSNNVITLLKNEINNFTPVFDNINQGVHNIIITDTGDNLSSSLTYVTGASSGNNAGANSNRFLVCTNNILSTKGNFPNLQSLVQVFCTDLTNGNQTTPLSSIDVFIQVRLYAS